MITDEQLKQWRTDAEKAFDNAPIKECFKHIENSCPENFIALIDRIEKMKEALEFYANENTWKNSETCDCGCPIIGDVGKIAREVLND